MNGLIILGECHDSYTQYDCDVHLGKDGDADLGHSMKSERGAVAYFSCSMDWRLARSMVMSSSILATNLAEPQNLVARWVDVSHGLFV